jgi:hypothetical protein
MPSILAQVVQKLFALRGWSEEETKAIVLRNLLKLAGDDEWARSLRARSR